MSGELQAMVGRVSWFSPVDYEILFFFDQHDIIASSQVIAPNIGYDRKYVNKRLVALTDAGLFVDRGKGLYELSDRGRAFLDGDLPPSELEAHDPD